MKKSGAWYTYDSDQLGQGKENARTFLEDNPDLADDIEKRIKDHMGIGPRVDAPADEQAPRSEPPESAVGSAVAAAKRGESAASKRAAVVSIDS